MRVTVGRLRRLVREALEGPTVLYHGTLSSDVPSILRSGIKAGEGWGGAEHPGVFLCRDPEDAYVWGATKALGRKGAPPTEEEVASVDPSLVSVLEVHVPPEAVGSIASRQKEFNRPGDLQFVGSVPSQWISVFR